jgi:hypothetical protein
MSVMSTYNQVKDFKLKDTTEMFMAATAGFLERNFKNP